MLLAHSQSGAITLRAAIQRYFEVALYLLVLTGFGTLASTGGVDLPTMSLAGAAVLFRGYLLATRRTFLIPERGPPFLPSRTLDFIYWIIFSFPAVS